jgi:hypothetical protein
MGMGLGKFPHPQLDMGITALSYYYHRDGSEERIYPWSSLTSTVSLATSGVGGRRVLDVWSVVCVLKTVCSFFGGHMHVQVQHVSAMLRRSFSTQECHACEDKSIRIARCPGGLSAEFISFFT